MRLYQSGYVNTTSFLLACGSRKLLYQSSNIGTTSHLSVGNETLPYQIDQGSYLVCLVSYLNQCSRQ